MKKRNGKYYFSIWSGRRILALCAATPIYMLLAVACIGNAAIAFRRGDPIAFLEVVLCLMLLTRFYAFLAIPRYAVSMKAVRKYLTYRQLTRMLQNETFSKWQWTDQEEKVSNEETIWASASWMMVKGVLIPKATIVGVEQMVPDVILSHNSSLSLFTMEGKSWPMREVDRNSTADFIRNMQRAVPNLNPSVKFSVVLWKTSYRKQMRQWFRKKVPNRAAYMELITNGMDVSDMPNVEIAYQKIDFAKI